ncbi:glycine zipper 2TM domain-containing protein [Salinarimonas ramus]|uniref:17 kDa surface antigen n=1 Tax=Salinarimonas ramus TaxID=690164 RepID=A0A917V5E9_9HYPH|nr:glycine zipper 2TM domain-containing protein [Salinarimonas ramus]GGK39218.1 17 kDa surface antigen [Salinarimonas ramus]
MKTTKIALAGALAATLSLGACAGAGPNQQVGGFSGALVGGIVGSQIGGGPGERIAAGLAGAAIGGLIGGQIGANLDAEEQRRAYFAQQQAFAAPPRQPVRWQGDDAYGEVIAFEPVRSARGFCREYQHTIYIGGRPQQGYGTACRQPDGSWQIVG